jgi:hypothetical protein
MYQPRYFLSLTNYCGRETDFLSWSGTLGR